MIHIIQNDKWNLDNLPFLDADVSALKIMQLIKHEFASADDKLLPRDSRIVIPQALQERVVELAYEGYQGKVKTNRLLRAKVWFLYMDAKCEQQVKACLLCQSVTQQSVRKPFQMSNLLNKAWEHVIIDFCKWVMSMLWLP